MFAHLELPQNFALSAKLTSTSLTLSLKTVSFTSALRQPLSPHGRYPLALGFCLKTFAFRLRLIGGDTKLCQEKHGKSWNGGRGRGQSHTPESSLRNKLIWSALSSISLDRGIAWCSGVLEFLPYHFKIRREWLRRLTSHSFGCCSWPIWLSSAVWNSSNAAFSAAMAGPAFFVALLRNFVLRSDSASWDLRLRWKVSVIRLWGVWSEGKWKKYVVAEKTFIIKMDFFRTGRKGYARKSFSQPLPSC